MARTFAAHRLDVYDVQLYATTSARGWAAIRRRFAAAGDLNPRDGGRTVAASWQPDDGSPDSRVVAVYVNPLQPPRQLIDSIAHEASHVADAVLSTAGIEPPADLHEAADEPRAYVVGWVAGWLWEQVDEQRRTAGLG